MLDAMMTNISPGFFRLLLASVVVLNHLSRLALGTMAVYVFFVLSGYWICQMYERRYRKAHWPYLTFLVSRMWRLLPVFLLINAIVVATHVVVSGGVDVLSNVSSHWLVSNVLLLGYAGLQTYERFLMPAWSLDIEFQFYVLAPIIFAILNIRPRFAYFALFTVSAWSMIMLLRPEYYHLRTIGTYMAFFAIGVVAARHRWCPSRRVAVGSIVLFVFALIFILFPATTRGMLLHGVTERTPIFIYNGPISAILAIVMTPLALWSVHQRSSRQDKLCGDLSYIVYLLHWEAAYLVGAYFGSLSPEERLPVVLVATSSVYIVALAIWRFYDQPLNRLRAQFVENRLLVGQFKRHATEDSHSRALDSQERS